MKHIKTSIQSIREYREGQCYYTEGADGKQVVMLLSKIDEQYWYCLILYPKLCPDVAVSICNVKKLTPYTGKVTITYS